MKKLNIYEKILLFLFIVLTIAIWGASSKAEDVKDIAVLYANYPTCECDKQVTYNSLSESSCMKIPRGYYIGREGYGFVYFLCQRC